MEKNEMMESKSGTDWDQAFLAYIELLANGSESIRVKATIEVGRRAESAPEHVLAAIVRVLVNLLEGPVPRIRDAAVYALLSVARSAQGSLCSLIGQSGAIPSLVRLLPLSGDSSRSLLVKCLRATVSRNCANRSVLARYGGLEAVLGLIPSCAGSTRQNLLEILSTLAMLREVRRDIVNQGGLPYLVEAVSQGRMVFRTRAAHAIGFISTVRRNRHMLVSLGAVDVLVGLLRDGDDPAKLVAGNSLGIVSSHVDYLRLVEQAGAIPLYAELLEGPEPLGREIAEDVFCILAVVEESAVSISRHLARILREGNEDAKAAAADVIWDLSSYKHSMPAIRDSGAIQLLVEILRDGNGELREKASGAIAQMSYEKDDRCVMAETGAIPILIDLLNCDSDELKENATEALINFSDDPLYRENVSVVLDLPIFRYTRERLARFNGFMVRSLGQMSVDQLRSDLDFT